MKNFYILNADNSVSSMGACQDEDFALQPLAAGQTIVEGTPIITVPAFVPPTATWEQIRERAYPPLAMLADAIYWQSKGDNSKMDTYLAQCAAVKAQFPKV